MINIEFLCSGKQFINLDQTNKDEDKKSKTQKLNEFYNNTLKLYKKSSKLIK